MNTLIEILYTLSTALLVPVILLLLGFVIWSLMELGGFLREAIQRSRSQPFYEGVSPINSANTSIEHPWPSFQKPASIR